MNSKKSSPTILPLSIASSIVVASGLFVFLVLPHFVQATTATMSSAVAAAVERNTGVTALTRMTETVKPAERNSEQWGDALCNDGTPFAFTIEKQRGVSQNNWVVYLEGGDFCDDNVNNCSAREEYYTTTLSHPDGFTGLYRSMSQGLFNNDPAINPDFATANKVFAHYCSSDLWSGTKDVAHATSAGGDDWYFAGKLNVSAMFEILKAQYGLDDTKAKVLFAGSSAGCFGVNANAAEVAALLPQSAAADRLKLVSDACFFPDFDNADHRVGNTDDTIGSALSQAYYFWGASVNTQCEDDMEARGEERGMCYLQENAYPYITSCTTGLCLDNLVQMSMVDNVGLAYHHISNSDMSTIKEWVQAMSDALSVNNIDWLFSGSMPYHKILTNDRMWTFGPSRTNTFGTLLRKFWKNQAPEQLVW